MSLFIVSSQKENNSAPWCLLGLSGLLCLGMSFPFVRPPWQAPYAGQVHLDRAIPADASGWQMRLDLRDRPFKELSGAEAFLGQLFGGEVPAGLSSNLMSGRVQLESSAQKKESLITPLGPLKGPGTTTEDPLFEGSPMAIFEWSRDAKVVRGNLYRSTRSRSLYSGRLFSVLPFPNLVPLGDGFQFADIGYLPEDCERILSIDPTLIRFPPSYRLPILRSWERWEFSPLKALGTSIGPAMTYARWRGKSLFSIGVKDQDAVREFIEKRFPESVIPTSQRWSYGSRVSGFDPDGPAWFLRGDQVVATTVGGTERLDQLLSAHYGEDHSFHHPSPLMVELRRLASSEAGWHLFILMADPKAAFRWGALIRWPSRETSQANGFLVVEFPEPRSKARTMGRLNVERHRP